MIHVTVNIHVILSYSYIVTSVKSLHILWRFNVTSLLTYDVKKLQWRSKMTCHQNMDDFSAPIPGYFHMCSGGFSKKSGTRKDHWINQQFVQLITISGPKNWPMVIWAQVILENPYILYIYLDIYILQ